MAKSISTIQLKIPVQDIDSDVHYFLNTLPFIGLEEKDDHWVLFWEIEKWNIHKNEIRTYFSDRNISFESELLEGENWNANWEESFSPVHIPAFCQIRAQFHPRKDQFEHDIVIDPKMAFGTGHHDTTYQMVKAMRNQVSKHDCVIDLGTGTGVLAILASKMGADKIVAVDLDPAAVENALENVELNNCHDISVLAADVTTMKYDLEDFDVILANINRNVLLNIEHDLSSHARRGTKLILSGVLENDASMVLEKYKNEWNIQIYSQAGDWVCIYGKKI